MAREFLGDDDFVMYLGDNVLTSGLGDLVDSFCSSRPDAQIMLTRVPDPRLFGVAKLYGQGRVVGLEEKPATPGATWRWSASTPSPRRARCGDDAHALVVGELEITEAIQWLIDSGLRVAYGVVTGCWKETGRVSDLLEVNRLVLETVEPHTEGSVDSTPRAPSIRPPR